MILVIRIIDTYTFMILETCALYDLVSVETPIYRFYSPAQIIRLLYRLTAL